ncbi:UDP-glucose 4-epimerase GalE [Oceanidesulfovibrio indonesiensis]|uniref:UDP-glucose 4-epimerase n=1 Tax=Oceanidesulfovibrio indonesiensis TaxID=54767 RepID=A0A7M3MIM3_9BACT|nr:UDP-glucose 4-epimerase GalE [Oceanidesulfovibrio indonesiensis]TVM19514.1 UDP-glucose 4-epimerase GalE [Oceanidesulfovibrio indonesiensis]
MPPQPTILIVGGAGYIGSHVNKELTRRGYRTLVLDNLATGHRDLVRWGEFLLADMNFADQLRLIFRTHRIDAVMHFAAFSLVGESVTDPQKYYQNNVAGTLTLLQAMHEAGVRRFIFSSTCATYGIPTTIPIPEDHPQAPISPYGRAKLMVENVLADYDAAYDMRYVSLRYFNAAGADPDAECGERHDPESHLIPLVLAAAAGRREAITIFGNDYDTPDGTCIRDYIHVLDLADAHILALEKLLQGGGSCVYNLGFGQGHSVREVIETARRVTGREIPVIQGYRRSGDPAQLCGDASRAVSELGWQPSRSDLEYIVRTAWNWHKTDWTRE